MLVVISHANPDPLYKQVTDQVKDAIGRGFLKPDTRLPSIRELSSDLGISPITIKRAYRDLESEGFIVTRSGLGSYVAEIDMENLRKTKRADIRKMVRSLLSTAERFGIDGDEIIGMIEEIGEE